jgi:hypothetical protein
MGDWKAVRLRKDAPIELYNLRKTRPNARTSPPASRNSRASPFGNSMKNLCDPAGVTQASVAADYDTLARTVLYTMRIAGSVSTSIV